MRSKKVIALLISLTLLVSSVLPGTLAVSIDQDTARSSVTLTSGEQETPTPAPEEQQEQQDQNEQENQNGQENICTCGSTDGTHKEGCPLYVAPEAPAEPEKTCTCGSTDGTHQEDCPLYTAPEAPADPEKTCTCGAAEGEAHKEGCPLYEAPDTLLATPAPVSDPAAKTLEIKITMDSTAAEKPYVLVDVTGPNEYSKRVAVQVNGGATVIDGLPSGEYTCTVVTGWSWRYTPDSAPKQVTLEANGENKVVTFTNTRSSTKWLDGNAYRKNTFSN